MSRDVSTVWKNTELRNPGIKHGIYRFGELSEIPSVPGIYSWYLEVDYVNVTKYSELFHMRRLQVEAKGELTENYSGTIYKKPKTFDSSVHYDLSLFQVASFAFCPPLYIGISKNLKARFTDHFSEFNSLVMPFSGTPTKILKTQIDTLSESSALAQRLAICFNTLGIFDKSAIFIKTIEMPNGYDWGKLQKIEKYLNRSYYPILGRK